MAASIKTWVDGSEPTCAAADLNGFELENNNLILSAGISLSDTDHSQTAQAVTNYVLGANYYTDSGTANTYLLNPIIIPVMGGSGVPVEAPTVYFTGMIVRFSPANANTGASTVNIAALGAVAIVDTAGSPLIVGDLMANTYVTLVYNGTNFVLVDNGQTAMSAWSTGDVKETYKTVADPGWILLNDGTIGDATSGAGYANANAQNLFLLLWTNCTTLQVYNSSGLPINRGISAAADWAANNRIQLPQRLGRAPASSGLAALSATFTTNFAGAPTILTFASTAQFISGMQVQFTTTGTLPTGLSLATNYRITVINSTQISVSGSAGGLTPEQNYAIETFVSLTGDGTGTQTMVVQFNSKTLGQTDGYKELVQTETQVGHHTHLLGESLTNGTGGDNTLGGSGSTQITYAGDSLPMNIIQPTAYVNYEIKL